MVDVERGSEVTPAQPSPIKGEGSIGRPMKLLRDADVDPAGLAGKRVAIIGYGNQGRAQALQRSHADVTLPPFDAADVVAVEVSSGGEFFLRNAGGLAQLADARPDQLRQVFPHRRIVTGCTL